MFAGIPAFRQGCSTFRLKYAIASGDIMAWYMILINLCARIFVVLILFSVLCRTAIIRETINTLHEKIRSKVKLVLFFSVFGGLDLFCGTLLPTVVVNNHSTYVISAGLIGGPVAGAATAVIISLISVALIKPAVVLSIVLTVAEGIIAGMLSKWLQKQNYNFVHAGAIAYALTSLYLAFVALFPPNFLPVPFTMEDIIFPLLFSVTVGTGSFIGLLEYFYNQQ